MAGGHTVSIEKIISRYGRSMANLAGGIDITEITGQSPVITMTG